MKVESPSLGAYLLPPPRKRVIIRLLAIYNFAISADGYSIIYHIVPDDDDITTLLGDRH